MREVTLDTLVLIKSHNELEEYYMPDYNEYKQHKTAKIWIDADELDEVLPLNSIICTNSQKLQPTQEVLDTFSWAIKEVYYQEDFPDMYI